MTLLLPVGALTVVYVLVARLERWPRLRFRVLSSPRPYLTTDVAWYSLAILATAISVYVFRPVLIHLAIPAVQRRIEGLALGVKFAIAIVVFDLVSFLVHRQLHRVDALWGFHKVHHSSLELDGFATTRAHMLENFFRFVPPQALLFALGMPVRVVAGTVAIAAIYGVSNHSNLNLDLASIERVLVTPRLHRRHHVPTTTQSNFGAILTVWDRLFGSLVRRETTSDERYGVPGEIETFPQCFITAFRQPIARARARV